MPSATLTIRNELGLHARAASRLVDCANRFECEIRLSHGEQTVNGKSIMGLLTLAAGPGMEVRLETDGADEDDAMTELSQLISSGFGEPEL